MKKLLLLLLIPICGYTAELQHGFNSPSFSGVGYSTHILTIKQLEDQGKQNNKNVADSLKAQADREAATNPQAQFVANLQARIYSQLAKQLTDSLFGTAGTPACTSATAGAVCGEIPDIAGNNITWKLGVGADTGMIVITIRNLTDPAQVTIMKVPSGTFAF